MFHTAFGQGYGLGFFIFFIIAVNQFRNNLIYQNIFFRAVFRRAGNNQRGSGFINQNGVNLIDDGIIERALNQLIEAELHIIAQVVKTKLVVGGINNIAVVGDFTLHIIFFMNNIVNGQPEETIYLPHPFGIAFGQIVVDRNDMDAFAFQSVQIGGQRSNQGFAFTGFHLGNHPLMQDNTANQLDIIMSLTQSPFGSLADDGKSLRQQIVKRFALFQALFKFKRFIF